jgi:hypothetical protein
MKTKNGGKEVVPSAKPVVAVPDTSSIMSRTTAIANQLHDLALANKQEIDAIEARYEQQREGFLVAIEAATRSKRRWRRFAIFLALCWAALLYFAFFAH